MRWRIPKRFEKIALVFSICLLAIDAFLILYAFHFRPLVYLKLRTDIGTVPDKFKIHHVHPHVDPPPNAQLVHIFPSGFHPQKIIIHKGQPVVWINLDNSDHWPASDPHPTHDGYAKSEVPGSYLDSVACTGPLSSKPRVFDPCGPLTFEAMWSFTFEQTGVWHYHDHLNSLLTGTIEIID